MNLAPKPAENTSKPDQTKPQPESFQSVEAAAQALTAALETQSAGALALPVRQLWATNDPHAALPPGQVGPGISGRTPFLRSRETVGLYICLCTLAGGKRRLTLLKQ